jgi:hypothetical protein
LQQVSSLSATYEKYLHSSHFYYEYGHSLLSPQAENEEAVTDARVQYKNAILRAGKIFPNERLINVFENNRTFEDITEQEPLKVCKINQDVCTANQII